MRKQEIKVPASGHRLPWLGAAPMVSHVLGGVACHPWKPSPCGDRSIRSMRNADDMPISRYAVSELLTGVILLDRAPHVVRYVRSSMLSTVSETAVPSAMLPVVESITPLCWVHQRPTPPSRAPSPVWMMMDEPGLGSQPALNGWGTSADRLSGSLHSIVAETHPTLLDTAAG